MKEREDSMPEKKRRKTKCVALSRKCEFVRCTGSAFFFASLFSEPFLSSIPVSDGSVSGR